jgi:hypothetical protein
MRRNCKTRGFQRKSFTGQSKRQVPSGFQIMKMGERRPAVI